MNTCSLCNVEFDLEREGGITEHIGICRVSFCIWCHSGLYNLYEQMRLPQSERGQATMIDFQVVSLCDLTGNMVIPWAEAGYRCLCLDIAHSIRREREVEIGNGSIVYRWADVRSLTPAELPGDAIVTFAFPPCTNLAVSGARDFKRKGIRGLIDGLELVEACRQLCEWSGSPWMLENPVSRLSSCWRKPDHTFHPWQFGDNYTKNTCLWTGNDFVMPSPVIEEQPEDCDQRIWLMSPGHNRAAKRSETPIGFARAVFEANHGQQQVEG